MRISLVTFVFALAACGGGAPSGGNPGGDTDNQDTGDNDNPTDTNPAGGDQPGGDPTVTGCIWTVTGNVSDSGTCGLGPDLGYEPSPDRIFFTILADQPTDHGTTVFMQVGAALTGTAPISFTAADASGCDPAVSGADHTSNWAGACEHGNVTLGVTFSAAGTPTTLANGNSQWPHSHGSMTAIIPPANTDNNTATGNVTLNAQW